MHPRDGDLDQPPPDPAGYPAPKLLLKYSYLPCTFVILTNRAEGLRLRRTRRGVCPHPSYNGVKRSLKNSCQLPKGAKRQLSVVSCQLSERKPLCTTWLILPP